MARVERFITGITPLEAPRLNQLADACNAFLNMRVSGGDFRVSGDMATLIIEPPEGTGSGRVPRFPFAIIDASEGDNMRIRIRAGTVNGLTPTAGGLPITNGNHFLSIPATRIIYLRATVSEAAANFGELTAVEILAAAALPQVTFAHPVIRIGTATVSDSRITAISQDVFASLQLVRFFQHYVWVPGGPAAAS